MERIQIWLALFFIYCFFGWIWESSYRTIMNKKLINSGFLIGPWIPIYGFGAILILISTFRFNNNIFMIYLIGLIASTFFEFIVGYIMEAIFHVRYWDYSHVPFNLMGYIALPVSLVWGLFAIILVKYINMPIYNYINNQPTHLLFIINSILIILFIIDVIFSTIQALNLKQIIKAKINQFINENDIINTKMINKAEKIIKRNPQSKSIKYQLSEDKINIIIKNYKNKKTNH